MVRAWRHFDGGRLCNWCGRRNLGVNCPANKDCRVHQQRCRKKKVWPPENFCKSPCTMCNVQCTWSEVLKIFFVLFLDFLRSLTKNQTSAHPPLWWSWTSKAGLYISYNFSHIIWMMDISNSLFYILDIICTLNKQGNGSGSWPGDVWGFSSYWQHPRGLEWVRDK